MAGRTRQHRGDMARKLDVQLSLRLKSDELEKIQQAAEKLWPNTPAPLTKATIVRALAVMKADEVLHGKSKK